MLPKTYNPQEIEEPLYREWETAGLFEPSMDTGKEAFAIMMPPPNVTGTLHVGHVLDNTLPDMLVRRARMQGKDAIYQPGTDHASIAVHVVLDKQFAKEGTNRFELGREKFMERAWEWKKYSAGTITSQMRRIGLSCAWQRERFTMDEGLSRAVEKVFIDLYNRGLIYRGKRLVNWDPKMQTSISDVEVKHKEIQGHLWHLNYPLASGEGHLTVATTRPETMLGDTAVAVNPKDERYTHLVGQMVALPLTGRQIPIIADDYVDPEFGSGVVKITPAHDFNDFEVGKRHDLEMINILTPDGHINKNAPATYQGLERFAARKQVVADFEAASLLEKVEPHTHAVGHAERDNTILEPFLTDQWYVKAGPLAEKCLKAADEKKIKFLNKRDEKVYRHWLENIQDWCISRQLWWGHRIPAWYKGDDIKVQATCPGEGWAQDPDILDTWFSSALWPFSTLGWPDQTPELKKFYPQKAIMPGPDILTFWIIRMMMMGLEFMEEAPFHDIYTHALIRDGEGQKMSKSKGNVVDPMKLIEAYGADALRFYLVSQSALGQDIRLSDKQVETARNFCTKLWNVARYADMQGIAHSPDFDPAAARHPVNRWILGELHRLIANLDEAYEGYRFNEVGGALYHFSWNVLCDWYVELSKPLINGTDTAVAEETRQTMAHTLETLLRLLSPVMPFISEKIWRDFTRTRPGEFLMTQPWPQAERLPLDTAAEEEVSWLINVISAVRNVRAELNIPPKVEISTFVRETKPSDQARLASYAPFLGFLAKVTGFTPRTEEAGKTDAVVVAEGFELILPLEGVVDFEAEKARVAKEIEKNRAEAAKLENLLQNDNFVARAPQHVVEENKAKLAEIQQDLSRLQAVYEAR